MSHLSWVRGLKQYEHLWSEIGIKVAPLMGAWIETRSQQRAVVRKLKVAPLMGAWIETI